MICLKQGRSAVFLEICLPAEFNFQPCSIKTARDPHSALLKYLVYCDALSVFETAQMDSSPPVISHNLVCLIQQLAERIKMVSDRAVERSISKLIYKCHFIVCLLFSIFISTCIYSRSLYMVLWWF